MLVLVKQLGVCLLQGAVLLIVVKDRLVISPGRAWPIVLFAIVATVEMHTSIPIMGLGFGRNIIDIIRLFVGKRNL